MRQWWDGVTKETKNCTKYLGGKLELIYWKEQKSRPDNTRVSGNSGLRDLKCEINHHS